MTDTKSQTRTEAERITREVAKICGCAWESCTTVREATTDAIDKALRARDERAAKIADKEAAAWVREANKFRRGDSLRTQGKAAAAAAKSIATAIRKDDA